MQKPRSLLGIAARGDYDDLSCFNDALSAQIRVAATRKEKVAVRKRESKSAGVHVSMDSSLGLSDGQAS
jgi:glycyl-tRNA synthetase (class II)